MPEAQPSVLASLKQDLKPKRLFPLLLSGSVFGVIEILFVISMSALVFSGTLSEHLYRGAAIWYIGGALLAFVNVLLSSYPGVVVNPQDSPVAILAIIAAGIAEELAPTASSEEIFATILAVFALSTLLTGAGFYLFGVFNWGSLMRFIPYPVIGGFLAGTGWLLSAGALGLMVDINAAGFWQGGLFEPAQMLRWLPPMLWAVISVYFLGRSNHPMALPGFLFGGIALFYIALAIAGISVAEAQAQGWILGGGGNGAVVWRPLTLDSISLVQWPAIFKQSGNIFAIVLTSLFSMVLNLSGIEIIVKRNFDMNKELRAAGAGNLAAGLVSGTPGFAAVSFSTLGYKIGMESRIIGLTVGAMYLVGLFLGESLLSFFPTPVLGYALFLFGFFFLKDWLVDGWKKFSRLDYLLVVLIVGTIAIFGFLQGIVVGLILAVITFVVNYSQVDVISHRLSGANYRSVVSRRRKYQQILKENGEQIQILKLRGYVFFGTASNLVAYIQEQAYGEDHAPLKYLLLDFKQVSAFDSSALNSFGKMRQMAESKDFILIFVDVSEADKATFAHEGFDLETDPYCKFMIDLDHGVEWCENQIIKAHNLGDETEIKHLADVLREEIGEKVNSGRLMKFFEERRVKAGEVLIAQGSPPESLFFIEMGQVTIELTTEEGEKVRLRTFGSGTIVGEIQVYLDHVASASVIMDQPGIVHALTLEAMAELEKNDPEIAAVFHKYIAYIQSERLIESNNLIDVLLD